MEKLSIDEAGSGHVLQKKNICTYEGGSYELLLCRFILEVRAMSGKEYNPDSLCCGLQWSVKNTDQVINTFEECAFAEFHGVLDGKLKQLNRTGQYIEKRKAELITVEMEDKLWESGLLDDHSPRVLVDTLVY